MLLMAFMTKRGNNVHWSPLALKIAREDGSECDERGVNIGLNEKEEKSKERSKWKNKVIGTRKNMTRFIWKLKKKKLKKVNEKEKYRKEGDKNGKKIEIKKKIIFISLNEYHYLKKEWKLLRNK